MTVVPAAGHNDLFEKGAWEKVETFLESLKPVPVVKGGHLVGVAAAASGEVR
jgi:hypothetical protein